MPFDPALLDGEPFDEDDPLLQEGRQAYSWERLSQDGNLNEGWGHETPATGRRRRRRYEGDTA